MMMEGMMEEKTGFPWWGYVIIGVVLVGEEGRDMFNLQMDAGKIGDGICEELNREMSGRIWCVSMIF